MKARLADIAAHAGVSEATVSRVLNAKPGVAPTSLYGDASLAVRDDEVHLPGDGPAVQVWQL